MCEYVYVCVHVHECMLNVMLGSHVERCAFLGYTVR